MNEKKDKEMKQELRVLSDTLVSVKITMPMTQWVEWDNSCKNDFGDVRWMKMWYDHKIVRERSEIVGFLEEQGLGRPVEKEKVEEVVNEKLGTFSEKKGD